MVLRFSWAYFPPEGRCPGWFDRIPTKLTLEEALEVVRENRLVLESLDRPGSYEEWPGPPSFLPIAYMDGSEFLAIDTSSHPVHGGSVWWCFTQAENMRLFGSLADAIETAMFFVLAGEWVVADNGYGLKDRVELRSMQ